LFRTRNRQNEGCCCRFFRVRTCYYSANEYSASDLSKRSATELTLQTQRLMNRLYSGDGEVISELRQIGTVAVLPLLSEATTPRSEVSQILAIRALFEINNLDVYDAYFRGSIQPYGWGSDFSTTWYIAMRRFVDDPRVHCGDWNSVEQWYWSHRHLLVWDSLNNCMRLRKSCFNLRRSE
jgi:hypothetical protein